MTELKIDSVDVLEKEIETLDKELTEEIDKCQKMLD